MSPRAPRPTSPRRTHAPAVRRPLAARAWACAAIAGLVALPAAAALADERDDRIRELEATVRAQGAEQARLRAKVDALEADRAAGGDADALRAAVDDLVRATESSRATGARDALATGGGGSSLRFGGYFSTRFADSALPGEHPSFQDMRLVGKVHAEVSRAVRFDGEVEFEHGGVSDESDGEVKVEYAQVTLSDRQAFAVKAGSLLVPWGRFNQEHDDPLNELSSRPTMSRLVQGVVFAAPGVGVEGVVEASDDVSLNYDLVLVNGLSDDVSSDEGVRDARTLWEEDDNHDKTVFGRVGVTPATDVLDALDVGASFAWGRLGEHGRDDLRGWGLDAAAKWGPWEAKAEWAHLGIDRRDAAPPGSRGALGPVRGLGGWYGQVLHRFRDPWVRALPWADESASVALVLRRDVVDTNDRVRGAAPEDDERAWTIGVNYRPTTRTVLKFEFRKARSGFPGDEGRDRDLVVFEFATSF